jgi:S1-C subfamily serine protease
MLCEEQDAMQDDASKHDQASPEDPVPAQTTGEAAPAEVAGEAAPAQIAGEAVARSTAATPPRTRWRRPGRLVLGIGAAATAVVAAFAAFAVAGGLSGSAQASSVIPSPPKQNKVFVEDEEGTGADNQANILSSAAPGMVHVVSATGGPVGAGVILTPSGLVLTSAQALQGARRITVSVVLSGRSFRARLIGTSPSHDLGLLQIVGGPRFRSIVVGNSRDLIQGDAVTAVGSSGLTRTFTLDVGNLTGAAGVLATGGQRLSGLLVSTDRVMPGEETGGPLVNLSGQTVGINVAGTGSGLHYTGFAVPINEALAVARLIQAAHPG